jgi:ATP adenylyltransferase/5',5'''-P-1,P-4-tetraphosphate phosphorylase II
MIERNSFGSKYANVPKNSIIKFNSLFVYVLAQQSKGQLKSTHERSEKQKTKQKATTTTTTIVVVGVIIIIIIDL